MPGWRDRAIKVEPQEQPTPERTSSWRDRAVKVEAPEVSRGESAAYGAAEGASLGFADELIGGIKMVGQMIDPRNLLDPRRDEQLRERPSEAYRRERDDFRGESAKAYEANPGTYTASAIAGGLAVPVPGAAGRGALQAAKAAVVPGAVAGAGFSDADLTKGEFGEFAKDTAVGGTVGAVAGAGFDKLASGTANLGRSLKTKAETRGAKALGFIQGELNKRGLQKARGDAREALDEGVIGPFASAETMAGRAESVKDRAGSRIGEIFDAAEQAGGRGIDARTLAARVQNELSDFQPGSTVDAPYSAQIEAIQQDIFAYADESGFIRPEMIPKLKSLIGKSIYADPLLSAQNIQNPLKRRASRAYGQIRGEEQQFIEEFAPDVARDFEANERVFEAMSKIGETLRKRTNRDVGNNLVFGMTPMLMTIGGTTAGGPVGGAMAYALSYLSRQKGDQVSAVVADKLSRVMTSRFAPVFEAAAKQGPKAVIVAHQVLLNSQPEYRELVESPGAQR